MRTRACTHVHFWARKIGTRVLLCSKKKFPGVLSLINRQTDTHTHTHVRGLPTGETSVRGLTFGVLFWNKVNISQQTHTPGAKHRCRCRRHSRWDARKKKAAGLDCVGWMVVWCHHPNEPK